MHNPQREQDTPKTGQNLSAAENTHAVGIPSKACRKCGEVKPLEAFHPRRDKRDGRTTWCRACAAEIKRRRTASATDADRARWCEAAKRSRAKLTPEQLRERERANYARNQAQKLARRAVHFAIKSGRLVRPDCCELCGVDPGRDPLGRSLLRADHHAGYSREHRLTVRFVCPACDGAQIRQANQAKRAQEAA